MLGPTNAMAPYTPALWDWQVIAELPPNSQQYDAVTLCSLDPSSGAGVTPPSQRCSARFYRVKAWNIAGESAYLPSLDFSEPWTLTIRRTGMGIGRITDGGLIDCGEACEGAYLPNIPLELTAIADAGSVFAGWIGADDSYGDTCSVLMNRDREVTAIFDTVDDPPPTEIQLLHVRATPWSSKEILLEWDHVEGRTGYRVEEFNSDTGQYNSIGDVPADNNWAYVYPLDPGVEYWFKVLALVDEEVLASGVVIARTLTEGTAAQLPLSAVPASDTTIVVYWDYVAANCDYNIYMDGGNRPLNKNLLITTVPNITITHLAPGTYHTFVVEEVCSGVVCARGEAGARTYNSSTGGERGQKRCDAEVLSWNALDRRSW